LRSVTVFRAYDVRGIWGTEVTEDLAKRLGASFGSFAEGSNVSLGRDTRLSGPLLSKAFLKGLLSTGCQVYSYGVLPISLLSFITWQDRLRAAAYISASHNPPEYNGIRFRTGDGYGLLYRDSEIMNFYREGGFLAGEGRAVERSAEEALQRYGDYVAGRVELERPLKVVLDAGNGSACMTGPLYKRLGFQKLMINEEMDGRFPGRGPAPDEESLRLASRAVVEAKADYGIGFDPDADRGIAIDDRGSIVAPEKVAIILARRRYKPGDLIISGFDCSMILEHELEKDGFVVARERVGDVFIANRVKNSGAVLGVERSGHFFLPEFQYSDDPFAMSLALGEIISQGERLSQLAEEIPSYPYRQKSIRFQKDPSIVMKKLEEALARFEPDVTDGLKISTESYSVLIRPSNTEPLIRLYIETMGSDIKELEERFEGMIKECAKD
jgi:phosphomannomutase/phosphoglucomutase